MDGALVTARVLSLIFFLVGTFIFGSLPLLVQKKFMQCDCGYVCKPKCRARKGKLVTSFLIYLGGGVLLATCFIHLLPEAREGFEDHDGDAQYARGKHFSGRKTANSNDTDPPPEHEHHESFPLPELIVCLGFFAVYLFEQVISHFVGGHSHSHVPTETKAIRSMSRSSSVCCERSNSLARSNSVEAANARHIQDLAASEKCPPTPPVITQPKEETTLSVSGLLTVAALSFHSLFEGFAVGLQPDATSTWILFLAVAVHKFVISFVVGVEVLATGGGKKQLLSYMGVFSVMSPIGMAIAMITAVNVEDSNPVVVSVLNGIATGTLLYVTFFEILQNDEHKDVIPSKVQFLATFCGFGLMCLVQYASTFA